MQKKKLISKEQQALIHLRWYQKLDKDLASLKTKVDNLDVNILKTVPSALSKLNNAVDNDVVKKLCMINWLSKSILLIIRYQAPVD